MAKLKYWIWLSAVEDLSPRGLTSLLKKFENPENIYFADPGQYEGLKGITPHMIQNLSDKSMRRTEKIISECERTNITWLTLQDADYPERLRQMPDPPATLYVRGKLPPVDELCAVAVVGTRKASPYGLKMAAKIGGEITRGGGLVVSGLASGVDSTAMEAALRAGGETIGVVGTAIDQVYPSKNKELFARVAQSGAVVGEYPPGYHTWPENFRIRNRIISALSVATLVVEADERSGALITARHALEQNRDVYAVPCNADALGGSGVNRLISEGAGVATCGEDILRVYENRFVLKSNNCNSNTTDWSDIHIKKEKVIDKPLDMHYIDFRARLESLPETQRAVALAITRPDMPADDIIVASGLSAATVLSNLTMLQISGIVKTDKAKKYSLNI